MTTLNEIEMQIEIRKTQIVQIVAGLPPHNDGVGHYALLLANEMRKNHGIQTHFVVCKLDWNGATSIDGFPAYLLAEHTPQALCIALSKATGQFNSDTKKIPLLLQLSAYGYHQQAYPFWLEKGLKIWLGNTPQACLMTMFHELYAFGYPWRKSFWVSPLQRLVAAKITKLSTTVFTNMQSRADILARWDKSKDGKVQVFPVYSTIDEPQNISLLHDRARRLIIFGTAPSRLRVWQKGLEQIKHTCAILGITEICDIGSPLNQEMPSIPNTKVIVKGILPEAEISALMSNSIAGFFDYFNGYLGKSSIFAAYCAHGLLAITLTDNHSELEGLIANNHYWVQKDSAELSWNRAQQIAECGHNWYNQHKLSIQSDAFALKLKEEL